MVGRAIVRRLEREDVRLVEPATRVDYRRQAEVEAWMKEAKPQLVFVAAATVGGIWANSSRPAEFIYDNMMIEANLIEAARQTGVERLVFLGSSCIYPKAAPQPMAETALMTGPLEPTNQWYAVAKIAGIKLVEAYRRQYGCDFISAQPSNLYGPFDNFDLEDSHVIPALMRKAHEAAESGAGTLTVWGSGRPLREFLHVDDLADALVFLAQRYSDDETVNVGSGEEVAIADLARAIARTVGLKGDLTFDPSKPDGAPRKLVDVTKLSGLGWKASTPLEAGLASTYRWFLDHRAEARGVDA
jgi:GDP-L-fucose synthase